ncbi:MAG: amidohydrolase, partial [Proteobacteria bacterium]|nr:amidohydrolase [Pseudomonadota bacterium]
MALLVVLAAVVMAAAAVLAVDRRPTQRLAIFDAHIHYSASAWSAYPPLRVRRLLREAGVARGAVSSSPDEGTQRLIALNRARFVGVLRPYRQGVSSSNWIADLNGIAYLKD